MRWFKLILTMIMLFLLPLGACLAETGSFVGEWQNTDLQTRGVTRMVITVTGNTLNVQTWGSCHPIDCDWGKVVGRSASNNRLTVVYNEENIESTMWLTLSDENHIEIKEKIHFTDGNSRPDRTTIYQFERVTDGVNGYTPRPGSAERKAILDGLRAWLKDKHGIDAVFVVIKLNVQNGFATTHVLPQSKDGSQHYEDIVAALKKDKDRWSVVEILNTHSNAEDDSGDP
ncbi:MAG: hypothetical protein HKM93_01615 [Desulfobacteraceae bacterium]|nr:hypothetical protein [Desulfobacteraceae bacterium]